MPTMILTKTCKVQGVKQPVGHRFDVPEKEARLWAALGRAKNSTPASAAKSPEQSDVTSNAQLAGSPGAPAPERRSGRHNRRDMRAED